MLVFPSEQGRAWDYENNGMVSAVADLVEAGRVKLYCVDSYDAHTWSNSSIPLEARAQRHGAYESWITNQVAGFIGEDSPGVSEVIVTGCSLGAYHALNFALTRADLFPVAICQSGNYDPSQWHAWGDRGDAAYFTNPSNYVPNLHGDHLDWLRSRVHLVLTVGQGAWETEPTGSLPSARHMGGLLAEQGHLPRPRRVGPRLRARLALVAEADRPPPAPVLLGTSAWEFPETPPRPTWRPPSCSRWTPTGPSSTPPWRRWTGRAAGSGSSRTAFYPVGGGQPWDLGTLQTPTGTLTVTGVRRERGPIWHTVEGGDLPEVGEEVHGQIDWDRRHRLMRTHTALHILCGVIWADYKIPVTGGNMEPMKGRLDFPFPAMSADLGAAVEKRINDEIARAHEIVVDFLPRSVADTDPALIRTPPT